MVENQVYLELKMVTKKDCQKYLDLKRQFIELFKVWKIYKKQVIRLIIIIII